MRGRGGYAAATHLGEDADDEGRGEGDARAQTLSRGIDARGDVDSSTVAPAALEGGLDEGWQLPLKNFGETLGIGG